MEFSDITNFIVDKITWIGDRVNPLEVDWNNYNEIIKYVLNVGIVLFVIIAIIALLINFGKIRRFLASVNIELKKVKWLPKNRLYKLSLITIVLIVVFTLIILLLDQAFLFIRNLIILRES